MSLFKITPKTVRALDNTQLETLLTLAKEYYTKVGFWKKSLKLLEAEKKRRASEAHQ